MDARPDCPPPHGGLQEVERGARAPGGPASLDCKFLAKESSRVRRLPVAHWLSGSNRILKGFLTRETPTLSGRREEEEDRERDREGGNRHPTGVALSCTCYLWDKLNELQWPVFFIYGGYSSAQVECRVEKRFTHMCACIFWHRPYVWVSAHSDIEKIQTVLNCWLEYLRWCRM